MSGLFSSIEISAQGLTVQRAKMNTTAENIANAETTETPEGGPYQRRRVVVSESKDRVSFRAMVRQAGRKLARTHAGHISSTLRPASGQVDVSTVEARETVDEDAEFKLIHDPSHPQADADGYVKMPGIEIVNEMVDMMAASRAYEANTVAIATAKEMAKQALDI